MKIELSKQFQEGRLNTPFFKDIQAMSDEELQLIFDFMQSIEQGKRLSGKNKPSWLDDNLNDIPNTEVYKQNEIWHYHCGPYNKGSKYNPMSGLKMNLDGETSGPVIHYQKISDEHIVIIAFFPTTQTIPTRMGHTQPNH